MYQAWFHLTGEWPPTPNLSEVTGGTAKPGTLADSTACFRGVKRPYLTEDDGASVFVYILKPESTLVFDPRPPVRRPVIKMLDSDLLLAAYVRLADRPVVQGGEPVVGFVTRLETIEGGPAEPGLPLDYLERYENRVW